LNQANNIIIGGAPISAQLENQITKKVTASIYQTYGMTETLTHVAVRDLKEEAALYEGLKGVSFKRDQRGCLQIQSPLSTQWLTTNDLVELTSSGFYWKGRFDLVINSAGYKIHVDSLELRLGSQIKVNQLFICGIYSSEFGEECIVVSNQEKPLDFEKVFESDQFHKYEKPKKWVTLAELPFGNSGKIQRVKLKELATQAVLNGEYQNLI
jgi:O-succinylbenzoic acid--CoA ligase